MKVLRQELFEQRIRAIMLGATLPFTIYFYDAGRKFSLVKEGNKVMPRHCRLLAFDYPSAEIPAGPVKKKLDMIYEQLMLVEGRLPP